MANNIHVPYASCSNSVCGSPALHLKAEPYRASAPRREKVHQAVGLLSEAATFMMHSKPVNVIEDGLLISLRARHRMLRTVAVPYDWVERCKSLLNEARWIDMRKEDCHQHSSPCKSINKLEEAEALLSNEQVQELLTLLYKAVSAIELAWPFILDVSCHPMPWQADTTLPWTIAVPITWLNRCHVFLRDFQAIEDSIE